MASPFASWICHTPCSCCHCTDTSGCSGCVRRKCSGLRPAHPCDTVERQLTLQEQTRLLSPGAAERVPVHPTICPWVSEDAVSPALHTAASEPWLAFTVILLSAYRNISIRSEEYLPTWRTACRLAVHQLLLLRSQPLPPSVSFQRYSLYLRHLGSSYPRQASLLGELCSS